MKIAPVKFFSIQKSNNNYKKINQSGYTNNVDYSPISYPANYYLSFGARVDKGLNRFYEQNKDVMPITVKSYIENLSSDDKQVITPLQAQANAFEFLTICDSVDDVKDIYDNEPLFENLKKATDTRATRGLLYDIRLMSDDIKSDGDFVVKGEEDLTLYLLKKVYLESKTIAEINEDLHSDLNPIFQNDEKNYVSSSTLSALGIKLPKNEYLTSLRYTREGYSDKMGQVISDRWASLSDEEKMSRIDALLSAPRNLSPERAKQLSEKRSQMMKDRWAKLTAEQKVELIEKLKTGNEDEKLAMINAWNKCPEIRTALSEHFIKNNFHNTSSILYSSNTFSQSMRKLMTDFWNNNPAFSQQLGEAITQSYKEISEAKINGTFDDFSNSVIEKQKQIKAEMKSQKSKRKEKTTNIAEANALREDSVPKKRLKSIFDSYYTFLPKDLKAMYFESLANMSDDDAEMWFLFFTFPESLKPNEIELIKSSISTLGTGNKDLAIKTYAFTRAMLATLSECRQINNSNPYNPLLVANFADLLPIVQGIKLGAKSFNLDYLGNDKSQIINFDKKLNFEKLYRLYNKFSMPLTDKEVKHLTDLLLKDLDYANEIRQEVEDIVSHHGKYMLDLLDPNKQDPISVTSLIDIIQLEMSNEREIGLTIYFDSLYKAQLPLFVLKSKLSPELFDLYCKYLRQK